MKEVENEPERQKRGRYKHGGKEKLNR